MAAGAIAGALGVPNSSLSFHLAQLSRAGLIRQERQHRSIIYRADYDAMNALRRLPHGELLRRRRLRADAGCVAANPTQERKCA